MSCTDTHEKVPLPREEADGQALRSAEGFHRSENWGPVQLSWWPAGFPAGLLRRQTYVALRPGLPPAWRQFSEQF